MSSVCILWMVERIPAVHTHIICTYVYVCIYMCMYTCMVHSYPCTLILDSCINTYIYALYSHAYTSIVRVQVYTVYLFISTCTCTLCSHTLYYCVHTSGGFLLMSFSGVVRRIGRELVILAGFISHMISFLLVFYTVPDDATAHLQPTAEVYLIDRQL